MIEVAEEMTDCDYLLIKQLIAERRKLQAELGNLTDKAIAEKFGISRHDVRQISRGHK